MYAQYTRLRCIKGLLYLKQYIYLLELIFSFIVLNYFSKIFCIDITVGGTISYEMMKKWVSSDVALKKVLRRSRAENKTHTDLFRVVGATRSLIKTISKRQIKIMIKN